MSIFIEKRNGSMELLNPDKFHQHVEHAAKGIDGISISEIEMNAGIQIVNGSKSEDIQNALINSCVDGTYENPKLDKVAARLLNQDLRKKVYESYEPNDIIDTIVKNCKEGVYDEAYLYEHYTLDELAEISKIIDYDKDDNFTYGGLKKNTVSYLIKQFDKIKETPQEMYLLINIFAFAKYKEKYSSEFRKEWIAKGYECLSDFYVSLPTPMIKQLRTTFRRFISCVLIPFGDTKHTIANANRAILVLVAGGCGLGLGVSDIRGLNAYIDNGRMLHEGILPILKGSEKITKAFTQPDRDGSSTEYFPWFHIEVENFMVLGNAKGTDDVRVRDMDHAIMFNDYFFEKYAMDEDVSLFYMNDVPDIMSYIGDYDKFKEIYEEAVERVPDERQIRIPAKLIFHTFIDERSLTSREYTIFMDNIQQQGSYDIPIKESNLCVAGNTKILTKEVGEIEIKKLMGGYHSEGVILYPDGTVTATCWDGKKWAKTVLSKTHNGTNLTRVTFSNGVYIDVTAEHKWYIQQDSLIIEKRTYELSVSDIICDFKLPDGNIVSGIYIISISFLSGLHETFCGNSGDEHKLVFNGILTGNCTEISQPNFPLYDTVNIKKNIEFATTENRDNFYKARREAYFHQDSSKIEYWKDELAKYYTIINNDIVDETKDYDFFGIDNKINLSEIGVCIIAGINLGHTPIDKLPMACEYLVRLEDEIIDYMDYDLPEIEKAAKMRRGIGIGFSDVFHLLAKNKVKYNTREGRQLLHDRVELCAYHMTLTSINLAKDFGPCQLFTDTKYSKGIMPIDTYRKSVDELVTNDNQGLDWEGLRKLLLKYGMRHSTLMANAPFGSSSIPSNSTPGIEPPRDLVTKKDGLPKIVPELEEYGPYYTTVWSDEFNNIDYFKFIACAQKFVDQMFSTNQYHKLSKYPNNKVPQSLLLEEVLVAQYYGHKSLYYLNVNSKDKDDTNIDKTLNEITVEEDEQNCNGGGCKI